MQGRDPDSDHDGSPGSEDCDDSNPRVAPGRDEECDELGWGLASGDLDGDGTTDLLSGDPAHDSASGAVYLVVDPSGTSAIADVALATFAGDTADSGAGQAMAVADMNGDGENDLTIGAPGLMGSGGVYVEYAPR